MLTKYPKKIIFAIGAFCLLLAVFWLSWGIAKIGFSKTASAQEELKIDLKLKNLDGAWQDSVSKTWDIEGAMPGQMMLPFDFCRWIRFKNAGNVEANSLSLSLENISEELGHEESDTMPESAEGMDEYVEIMQLRYGDRWFLKEDLLKKLEDLNGNKFIDLDDLEAQGLENLDPPCLKKEPEKKKFFFNIFLFDFENFLCQEKQLFICLRLHEETPNDYQGDKTTTDITFTLME